MEYIVIAFSKFQKIEAANLIIISFHGTFIVNLLSKYQSLKISVHPKSYNMLLSVRVVNGSLFLKIFFRLNNNL